jgi:hypothetical protein
MSGKRQRFVNFNATLILLGVTIEYLVMALGLSSSEMPTALTSGSFLLRYAIMKLGILNIVW